MNFATELLNNGYSEEDVDFLLKEMYGTTLKDLFKS